MNTRIQSILMIIMAVFLILVGGVAYLQQLMLQQQAASIRSINQQLVGLQTQQAKSSPVQPPSDVAPTPIPTPAVSQAGNPLLSPDGKWLLVYKKTGIDDVGQLQTDVVTHVFQLQSMAGQPVRELFRVVEQVEKGQDSPGTNFWSPLGWNEQGTKVYVTVTPILGGLGGNYPEADSGAQKLVEVDALTGQRKTILDLGSLWNVQNGIYHNITQPQKDILVYSTLNATSNVEDLYLSDFSLQHRLTVMTLKSDAGVAHVEMDAANTKMLITTFEGPNSVFEYTYKHWEYDIIAKNLRQLAS